jgi:sulfatase maturation enzyme AslB (radical SAM superfamily)
MRCKLCASYSPYYNPAPHYSYGELRKVVENFFSIVDDVDIFTITGGEPLLHKDIGNVLNFIGEYRDRINIRLELITNGTILPGNEVLVALSDSGSSVILDDYGQSLSRNADNCEAALKEYGIAYTRRDYHSDNAYYNGWVDMAEFLDDPTNISEAKRKFDTCVQSVFVRAHPIIDGKIYVCSPYNRIRTLGKIKDQPSEYFDLLDESEPIEERKRQMIDFANIAYLSSCAYCKGWFETSERFKPAEQLP